MVLRAAKGAVGDAGQPWRLAAARQGVASPKQTRRNYRLTSSLVVPDWEAELLQREERPSREAFGVASSAFCCCRAAERVSSAEHVIPATTKSSLHLACGSPKGAVIEKRIFRTNSHLL